MQPSSDTVDVIIVSHSDGPAAVTDCDEAIARVLEEELAVGAAEVDDVSNTTQQAAAAAVSTRTVDGKIVSEVQPSAPPLPSESASGWQHEEAQEQQQQQATGAASGSGDGSSEAMYDEQLARSLHDQELAGMSGEQQDRLTKLPALLTDSQLVRTLSDKLLQSMSLVKLLPKVNSSISTAAHEHQHHQPQQEADTICAGRARLEERLRLFELMERKVKGDGNCQFRALSDQLYRTPHLHGFVRERVCKQLAVEADRYAGFVPGSYRRYCGDMEQSGTWGDHVTLQACADHFGLRIFVLASYRSDSVLWIEPQEQRSQRVLWLSFWAEVHYNSLYNASEPPPPLPDDKLLGSRRLHSLLFG